MIVLECLFLTIAPCDAAEPWQLGSQDAATPMMQGIIDLHHDIFFFLILIFVFVSWILVRALWHFHYKKNPIPQRIVHGTTIEILWTIFPSIILMLLPSFALLYLMDEVVVDPAITIKAIGHQWYWTYEYSDYNSSDEQSLTFDSYTIPEDDPELGQSRLLEVDNRVVVPEKTHLRIIVTPADVPHSWAVPSLGVKCDAVHLSWINKVCLLAILSGVIFLKADLIASCESKFAFSPPPTPPLLPGEEGTPPPPPPALPDPVPEPVVIPQLDPPLLLDETRRRILYNRYLVLNLGGNDDLTQMLSILDLQFLIERYIEAALVDDGVNPNSIISRYTTIRGILHSPQGELLAEGTYRSYVSQIREQGTRESVPYRRILRAIRNYDLIF